MNSIAVSYNSIVAYSRPLLSWNLKTLLKLKKNFLVIWVPVMNSLLEFSWKNQNFQYFCIGFKSIKRNNIAGLEIWKISVGLIWYLKLLTLYGQGCLPTKNLSNDFSTSEPMSNTLFSELFCFLIILHNSTLKSSKRFLLYSVTNFW